MFTKPLPPVIVVMSKSLDLYAYLWEVRKTIQENLEADVKKPIDQQEYHNSIMCDLLDEVCSSIDAVQQQVDFDPTDLINDGEPPLSANERHSIAWKEHLEAHS